MSQSPPFNDDILGDDSLAPLKRNHACLQCKKRKVKCDATRPTCAPCMRSHAHALRTAQRNKTAPPPLVCTYTENDSPFETDDIDEPIPISAPRSVSRPATGVDHARRRPDGVKKPVKGSLVGRGLEREKDVRRDEEKETLLARIAELEGRLAGLTPPSDSNGSSINPVFNAQSFQQTDAFQSLNPSPEIMAENPSFIDDWTHPQLSSFGGATSAPQNNTSTPWINDPSNGANTSSQQPVQHSGNIDFDKIDFGDFLMLPAFWPPALPPPFLLEHLVETFFTHVPQLPRMLHRPSLLARLRLSPNSPQFPHPALLHAICAHASTYTAWVNSVPPENIEASVEKQKALHGSLDAIDDFGLSQGEAAQRAIRLHTAVCMFGGGAAVVEIAQASLILSDLYFSKGLLTTGWLISGTAARLIKALELLNKNKPKRFKEPLAPDAVDDFQREERLATVWLAFHLDSGMCMNSYWSGSFDLAEIKCHFPASTAYFKGKENSIPENPQNAHSADVLSAHPVADSFVLVAKASTLLTRVATWIREWHQRDVVDGDEMAGMNYPSFQKLLEDIHAFQSSVPNVIRSVFRSVDSTSNNPFDPNLLLVHILPNISFFLLYEPFVDWHARSSHPLTQVQRGYEAVLCVLHLIPSNLDVSLILTFTSIFALYTTGRIIANFVHRASALGLFGLAGKHRADLIIVQNLMNRYGQKHNLGQMMSKFLEAYVSLDPQATLHEQNCIEAARPAQFRTGSSFAPDGVSPTQSAPSGSTSSASGPSPSTFTPPGGGIGVSPHTAPGCMGHPGLANNNCASISSGRTSSGSTPASQMTDYSRPSLDFGTSSSSVNQFDGYHSVPPSYGGNMLGPFDTMSQNGIDGQNQGSDPLETNLPFSQGQSRTTSFDMQQKQATTQSQSRFAVGVQTVDEWDTCVSYAVDGTQIVWAGS